jgi:hemoglobin
MSDPIQPRRPSMFADLGGEEAVRRLVEAFYDIVEQEPEAEPLHRLHLRGHGVAHSREEQFNYLCGFFGGPSYYLQKHGHSRLREIHAHVDIGPELRDLWLACMRRAFDRAGFPPAQGDGAMRFFGFAAETARNHE